MSDADQQAVLTLAIKDKSVLYGAYMSFLQNGGLFVNLYSINLLKKSLSVNY